MCKRVLHCVLTLVPVGWLPVAHSVLSWLNWERGSHYGWLALCIQPPRSYVVFSSVPSVKACQVPDT